MRPEFYLPDAAISSAQVKVHFLQTADPVNYRPLFELTSQTVREYVGRHGFTCESFLGIVRGYHPWQASYNRIPLLRRLANTGFSGWVCYMDADAYIADLSFDLTGYLKDKREIALVIAPGEIGADWWNVNDGVFLLNLGHPKARLIVEGWNYLFGQITEDQLRVRAQWYPEPETNDQVLLWFTLQGIPDLRPHVLIDMGERILNYRDGRFIRQVLRAHGSMEDRLDFVQAEVGRVLGQPDPGRGAAIGGHPSPV